MSEQSSGFPFSEVPDGAGLDIDAIFGGTSGGGAPNNVNPFEAALAQQAPPAAQTQPQTAAPAAPVAPAQTAPQPAPQAVQQPAPATVFQNVQPVQPAPVPAAQPPAPQPPLDIDPLAAAMAQQEAKAEQKAAKSLFEKAPVFQYGSAKEDIADPGMTFEELRIAKSEELAARFNRDKEAFHACVPGAPCPTCRRLITEEALVEVRSALEQSSMATIAAGQEQRAQLNELMENDKKAKAVFEQFQADDVAKLEQELAALKAQKTDNSPADGLRAQIQQLTSDLEYGNLNEVEYAQMKECREELRECAANLKAAQAAALQKPEDYDRKIEAAQGRIKELKKLIADVAIYVSERAKLTFSALKMNKVEISLYDVVKSTGERKDVFKFTYGGRRYDRLSLSEKIRAGMEVSELMKRLTGRNYPVFVDNMESVDDLNNVRPTGQVIMAKCVSGAPLAVRPVRPIAAAEQRAA